VASTTTMSSSAAVDLALLGLLAKRARPIEELIEAVKRMAGGRFTPTAAFVEGMAAHLIETGCIERRGARLPQRAAARPLWRDCFAWRSIRPRRCGPGATLA
jgi:hypothetical protein